MLAFSSLLFRLFIEQQFAEVHPCNFLFILSHTLHKTYVFPTPSHIYNISFFRHAYSQRREGGSGRERTRNLRGQALYLAFMFAIHSISSSVLDCLDRPACHLNHTFVQQINASFADLCNGTFSPAIPPPPPSLSLNQQYPFNSKQDKII